MGWSHARASAFLGVSEAHLNYVFNGERQSRRLLLAIGSMGPSPVPYRVSGFARKRYIRGRSSH
jgi:hypothetical protein